MAKNQEPLYFSTMEKEFIKFYTGWLDSIETIPDEAQRGELALAIIRYAFKGEKYAGNSPFVCVLMPVIYKTIDTANFYAAAGYKGGMKAANQGATEGGRTHITDKQINKKQIPILKKFLNKYNYLY